jgi:hypothetical protein
MFQQTQTLRNELRAQQEDDQQYLHFSTNNHKTIAARNSNRRMSRKVNASSRKLKLKEKNNGKQHQLIVYAE